LHSRLSEAGKDHQVKAVIECHDGTEERTGYFRQDNKLVLFPLKVGADIPGARVKPELLEKLEELSRGKFQLDIKECVTYN
jgi:hypothetical protein